MEEINKASGKVKEVKRTELSIKIGEEIRRIRKHRGWSQEGFALECGIARSYMGVIERGKTAISVELLNFILTKLGTTLAAFFQGLAAQDNS